MFGSSSSKKDGERPKLDRVSGGPSEPAPKAPVKLREGGGSVLNAPGETKGQQPAERAKAQPGQAASEPPKKPKLHLMTSREEREREFLAAREQYLSKTLPEIQKEVVSKERSKAMDVLFEKLFAVVGLFLLAIFVFWLINNATIFDNWWRAIVDSIKVI
jgi:hypothetical protein